MAKIDHSTTSFLVYEDATEYQGVAEVTMPDINFITQTIEGAGISGTIDATIVGFIQAMSMSMKFRTVTEAAAKLAEPRMHAITLRIAQQYEDTVEGIIDQDSVKHVVRAMPKSLKLGTLKPASPTDASGEYAVHYWATYLGNKKVLEIDPKNFICIVNGVDYCAKIRKALGK